MSAAKVLFPSTADTSISLILLIPLPVMLPSPFLYFYPFGINTPAPRVIRPEYLIGQLALKPWHRNIPGLFGALFALFVFYNPAPLQP